MMKRAACKKVALGLDESDFRYRGSDDENDPQIGGNYQDSYSLTLASSLI